MAKPGFCQYPNYLLEAIFSAPLTCLEKDILLFLVRRTYGWSKGKTAEAWAVEVTCKDIAEAIQRSLGSVHNALASLIKCGIVVQIHTVPEMRGVASFYGVNPDTEDWGNGPEWGHWRAHLRHLGQTNLTTSRNVVSLHRVMQRHYIIQCSDTTLNDVVEQATNPTPTGPEEPGKTVKDKDSKDKDSTSKEKDSNDLLSGAARSKQRQDALNQRRSELMERLAGPDLTLVQAYLDNAANENASGKQTLGGEVSKLEEIMAVRDKLVEADPQDGAERWRFGLTQANKAGVPNPNYVKKAAASWDSNVVAQQQRLAGPAHEDVFGKVVTRRALEARRAVEAANPGKSSGTAGSA